MGSFGGSAVSSGGFGSPASSVWGQGATASQTPFASGGAASGQSTLFNRPTVAQTPGGAFGSQGIASSGIGGGAGGLGVSGSGWGQTQGIGAMTTPVRGWGTPGQPNNPSPAQQTPLGSSLFGSRGASPLDSFGQSATRGLW